MNIQSFGSRRAEGSSDDIVRAALAPIFRRSMFWSPEREAPSSWVEHVPFAFWLVDVLRPRRIVELGTHNGVSYSAMCQAVKTLGLATSCFAIDTWKGDEHAGFYGEEAYRDFATFHDRHYGAFSKFVRSTFDDALLHFEDGSIDLLHIDGLHTYEAAQHDYESWLPKLAPNAVLLFHDTNVRERDFGVFRLWNEISSNRPHFSFLHGFGLGVLGHGEDYPDALRALFDANGDGRVASAIREAFATLGRSAACEQELARLRAECMRNVGEIGTLREALRVREAQVSEQGSVISALHASTSWHITAPLRVISTCARQLGQTAHRILGYFAEACAGYLARAILSLLPHYRRYMPEWVRRFVSIHLSGKLKCRINLDAAGMTSYGNWILQHDNIGEDDRHLIRAHIASFDKNPKFSVLMPVYNTSAPHLRAAIDSVVGQLYPNWQLCIADDASTSAEVREILCAYAQRDDRIKVRFRDVNGGISACTNTALGMAVTGEWIVLMDHDDTLAEHALYLVAEAINRNPDVAIIYSDEDHLDEKGQRSNPYFKPDWDYDLFLGQNLISHLGVYRADLARRVGGFREGFEGSQDWDFALRVLEAGGETRVHHIPFVLYHWRQTSRSFSNTSLSRAADAARRAVSDHLIRTGQSAEATPSNISSYLRIRRFLPARRPLVSVIIPTRDRCLLLQKCVDGIVNRTGYKPTEIVIVDNGSNEPDALRFLTDVRSRSNFVVLEHKGPFNFSRLVNRGVAASSGEICLLLNNDVDVTNTDWLDEMVTHALRPEVGAVGAKLYFADDRLQHGGVVLGIGGVAAHAHRYAPKEAYGYFGRLQLTHRLSCVTAACLAVRRAVYDEVGGFDERHLAVAFNDVDFCIRVREAGYEILWTPHAELYHYESASRGADTTSENATRFAAEKKYMQTKWGEILLNDPFYNPNLSLSSDFFELAAISRCRKPWLTRIVHET